MGKCTFCGKWAGFFKTQHKECFENYVKKKQEIEKMEKVTKLNFLNIIEEILNHNEEIPSLEFSDYGIVPFLKKESLIYAEESTGLYQTKKKISYVGGSQGVSLRIAKGISYRVGAYKGNSVVTEEEEYICSGTFLFSTAGLYFKGTRKSLKIRYNKIISLECFNDGLLILKDGESYLPIFITFKNEEVLKKIYSIILKVITK